MTRPAESARREADDRLAESLLHAALRPEPARRERRIQRVLDGLADAAPVSAALRHEPAPRQPTPRQPTTRNPTPKQPIPPGGRRWAVWTAAATVLLAAALLWQSNSPSRQAYATVQRGLQTSRRPGARKYRFRVVSIRPLLGEHTADGELYVDGADKFVVRHSSFLSLGEFWVGGNDREYWIKPPLGPMLLGDRKMLDDWIDRHDDRSTPNLHVTTLLRRLSSDYELSMLPDETLPDSENGGSVVCRRVRGVLRSANALAPRVIHLWADPRSGVTRRLLLDWKRQDREIGPSTMTVELVGSVELPPDWFEASYHRNRSDMPASNSGR